MLDELVENFRKRMEPRWDQMRERRALVEIERAIEQRASVRRSRRRTLMIAAPMALSVAALLVAYVVGVDFGKRSAKKGPRPDTEIVAMSSTATAVTPPGGAAQFTDSQVLADGTQLELSHGARIELRSESNKRVELAQIEGRVHYRVTPVAGRAFVVLARGVQVLVKGTVFVVDIDAGKVSVSVEQGIVRVAASSGEVDLGVGDELSTPADQESATDLGGDVPSPPGGATPPRPSRSDVLTTPSANALLERADAERRAGDLASASTTLRELLGRYPGDRRAALAWFTLGKVERARDRAAVAAKAFQTSFSLAPDGAVGEDALAEQAVAWAAAGNPAASRDAAEQYLQRFPNGTHLARMQRILE
jgi:TolA-binding protein